MHVRSFIVFGAIIGALFNSHFGFAAESASSDPIVELPTYVVTDSRELPRPESWRYGEFPGFEILTNASDGKTQRMLKEFRLFNAALGVVWPALQPKNSVPVSIILCGRGNRFEAFESAGKTNNSSRAGTSSLYFSSKDRSAIVVDVEATVLNVEANDTVSLSMSEAGLTTSGIAVEPDKQLYREYVHFLLSRSEPRMPAWLEEGLAQLLMGMKFTQTYIEFAKLEDPNEISIEQASALENLAGGGPSLSVAAEDRGFQASLARGHIMGLAQMFAVEHGSPTALNPIGSSWAKQCHAFVHLCLYGQNKVYQKGFLQFIGRLGKEPATEELFKECFGMSYQSMAIAIRGYVTSANYESLEWKATKGSKGFEDAPPIALREATPSEVGRIKGETLLLAGRTDQARQELLAPYIRGERDPKLLAALGLFERAHGEEPRARKFLESAVSAKVARPEAYFELARMRFADARPDNNNKFSDTQVASIAGLLRVACAQTPVSYEPYELLADTWARSAATIPKEDAHTLVLGAVRFPTRLKLIYQAASFAADVRVYDAARSLAEHGVKYAPSPSGRARFEQLLATLPPATPPPPVRPATVR